MRPGRERGWLTAGRRREGGRGVNRQRSLRLALSWFSGTYRSSERGEPRGARRGGREEGSTNPTIQTTQPTNHPEQACVVSPSPLVPPPAVSLPPTCRSPPGALGEGGDAGRERGESRSGLPFVPAAISWTKSYRALRRERKMEDKPREQRNRTFFVRFN